MKKIEKVCPLAWCAKPVRWNEAKGKWVCTGCGLVV
jgi:hypothetical protein